MEGEEQAHLQILTTNNHKGQAMNWIGYAKAGTEVEAQEAIMGLGIEAFVPMLMKAERYGKNRRPVPVERAVLPNVIFIRGTADDFHKLVALKEISRTLLGFPDKTWARDVAPFIDACAGEYARMKAKIEAGERLSAFTAGEALSITDGAFADMVATFRRVVEASHEPFPMIEADVEIMGRAVKMKLDPLTVKKRA